MQAIDTATRGDAAPDLSPRRRLVALGCTAVAIVAHAFLQLSMLLTRRDFSLERFRGYFPYDQTSYLAMVVNGARGDVTLHEPFTDTGVNHYPHAYYVVLGFVARITGWSPVLTWQVVGIATQLVLVAGLALALVRLTHRPWTPLLAPLPFVIGTFAAWVGDGWYWQLEHHAVLWGGFGVLFALNGGSASLCIGALALLALVLVASERVDARRAPWVAFAACVAIGAMSAIQTYSFLATVYLAVYGAAAWALLRSRAPVVAIGSAVALVVLMFAGPLLAGRVGPLAMLVVGLVPALPGLWLLVTRRPVVTIACLAGATATALPQTLWTVHGVVTRDPFLLYRQVSTTADLAVPLGAGLAAAAIPLVALATLFAIGLRRRRALWIAAPIGATIAWLLLGGNDRWGAYQEPYRLWIDCFLLVSVAALPLVTEAIADTWRSSGRDRGIARVATVALVLLVVASSGDFIRFWLYDRLEIEMIDYRTSQGDAIATVAGPAAHLVPADGLRLPDPCIDPFMVKVRAQLPTAFYNYGMAWPAHEGALHRVLAARSGGDLAAADAIEAGVTTVLTDSACRDDWAGRYRDRLREIGSAPYTARDGSRRTITAWRLVAPG